MDVDVTTLIVYIYVAKSVKATASLLSSTRQQTIRATRTELKGKLGKSQ